jgi:hypothetical protein
VLTALAAASTASASVEKQQLLTIAVSRAPIDILAQDGSTVAWGWVRDGLRVTMRSVRASRRSAGFDDFGHGATPAADLHFFALGGERVLWATADSGNFTYRHLRTAVPGGRPRSVGELVYDNAGLVGTHAGGAAGDGSTLVFSTVEVGFDPATCDDEGLQCTPVVRGGGVWRIVGGRRLAVAGASPAFLLAAAGRCLAGVAASARPLEPLARLGPDRLVEVREVASGRLVGRLMPSGTVRALTLARMYAAVLVADDGRRRIERYALDGHKLSSTTVPAAAADELGASRSTIVFRVGRSIRALDVLRGSVRTVAMARSRPVGLSIESNRVMWAERVGGRSVVRALWL